MGRRGRLAIGAGLVLLLVIVLVVACRPKPERASGAVVGPVAVTVPSTLVTAATTSTTAAPEVPPDPTSTTSTTSATTAPPAPTSERAVAEAQLASLTVSGAGTDVGYDRDLFRLWVDADHDGCNTRCEVLEVERRTDLPDVGTGWYSAYDGATTADPSRFDVDHVVPLAEAWRSGASAWTPDQREAYANDLDLAGALIAVSASSNRSKGDRDPAEWRPPRVEDWCTYAIDWIAVKAKWSLSSDPAEVASLEDLLARC